MNLMQLAQSRQRFWPAELFRDGSAGLFTCSDAALLRTDSAGTTPVTASADYIGRQLDLSGNGYHFTQGTSTARFQFFGGYYKLDLTDDVMRTTLPAIASGTVVVLTTKGAWFDGFSCAAGAFNWGPISFTGGTALLFSALRQGANDYREIGRLIINRVLTSNEKAQLLAWAKSRGCPGEVTLGSNIVVNGGYDTDLSFWEILNGSATWDAGRAKLFNTPTTGGNFFNRFRQRIPTTAGKWYFATAQFTNTSFTTFLRLQALTYGAVNNIGGLLGSNNSLTDFASGGKTGIVFSATGTDQLSVSVDGTQTGTLFGHVDNITCREIIFP